MRIMSTRAGSVLRERARDIDREFVREAGQARRTRMIGYPASTLANAPAAQLSEEKSMN